MVILLSSIRSQEKPCLFKNSTKFGAGSSNVESLHGDKYTLIYWSPIFPDHFVGCIYLLFTHSKSISTPLCEQLQLLGVLWHDCRTSFMTAEPLSTQESKLFYWWVWLCERSAFWCTANIKVFSFKQSMQENVFKLQSTYAAFIPSPLSNLKSSLCVSTRCVWWRQPMDDTGQQTTEAYRPSRAKGDVLSFKPPICCPLLPCSAFLLSVCYFYLCISVSALHPGHLLFTSLAQIHHKSEQVNSQQHQQIISTQQRPPTF